MLSLLPVRATALNLMQVPFSANASGIASGESLSIADSLMIHDGGRYIHQTRASSCKQYTENLIIGTRNRPGRI